MEFHARKTIWVCLCSLISKVPQNQMVDWCCFVSHLKGLGYIVRWMWVKTLYPQWTSRLMVIPYTTWLVGFDPYQDGTVLYGGQSKHEENKDFRWPWLVTIHLGYPSWRTSSDPQLWSPNGSPWQPGIIPSGYLFAMENGYGPCSLVNHHKSSIIRLCIWMAFL